MFGQLLTYIQFYQNLNKWDKSGVKVMCGEYHNRRMTIYCKIVKSSEKHERMHSADKSSIWCFCDVNALKIWIWESQLPWSCSFNERKIFRRCYEFFDSSEEMASFRVSIMHYFHFRGHSFSTCKKFSKKRTFLPLIRTRTFAYQT